MISFASEQKKSAMNRSIVCCRRNLAFLNLLPRNFSHRTSSALVGWRRCIRANGCSFSHNLALVRHARQFSPLSPTCLTFRPSHSIDPDGFPLSEFGEGVRG